MCVLGVTRFVDVLFNSVNCFVRLCLAQTTQSLQEQLETERQALLGRNQALQQQVNDATTRLHGVETSVHAVRRRCEVAETESSRLLLRLSSTETALHSAQQAVHREKEERSAIQRDAEEVVRVAADRMQQIQRRHTYVHVLHVGVSSRVGVFYVGLVGWNLTL